MKYDERRTRKKRVKGWRTWRCQAEQDLHSAWFQAIDAEEEKVWWRTVKWSFPQFHSLYRCGRTHTAHWRESQEVWMAHNTWKDLNFEIGWLLNCCNHYFSGFPMPQKRKTENNISNLWTLKAFFFAPRRIRKRKFSDFHASTVIFPFFSGQSVTFLHFLSNTSKGSLLRSFHWRARLKTSLEKQCLYSFKMYEPSIAPLKHTVGWKIIYISKTIFFL